MMSALSRVICAFLVSAVMMLGACAPADNPPGGPVDRGPGGGSNALCFDYFQRCINPIFDKPLPIDFDNNGSIDAVNTCAGAGCHDNTHGTGGAFRVIPNLAPIDLSVTDPSVIIGPPTMDMFRNFYSTQGASDLGSPPESRMLTKPLVEVLHGGGRVFFSRQDPDARQIQYWIENPAPAGKDGFCAECNSLFNGTETVNGKQVGKCMTF